RWVDMQAGHRDMFGTKIEMRLGDPADSAINRRAAINVPEHPPGHGLTPDGLHFLTGLRPLDGQERIDDLADGVAAFAKLCHASWAGPSAPGVRLLPAELPYEALPIAAPDGEGLPIGVAEADLQPVYLDFCAEPHLLVFGDVESGKSSFLRGLARSITRAYPPERARLMSIDQRRSLLGCVESEHLIGYGSSAQVTSDLAEQVAVVMGERLAGPDVTPEQLRNRS